MKILDISKHQAGIVLSSLTGVDGYIFRATVGSSEYDSSVEDFISQAKAIGAPYGFYVADYAHTTDKAIAEADKVCDLADIHGVNFPIFFDTEGFSNEYITETYGISHTPELVQSLTTAFCERVKERGYVTGVYFNKNYHDTYYTASYFTTHPDYVKWLARPGVSEPDIDCALWQYASDAGTEFGYSGNIDKNEVIDFEVFSIFEDCNAQYQVTADNCQYFYSADVDDVVDYLENGQVITAHARSTNQIGGFDWIKICLDGDSTEYYVVVLDDRLVKISETEVGFEKCDIQYKVVASNCEYFYSADVNDVVGYLDNGQIITAYEKSVEQIGGYDWIKIYLEGDETEYYVVMLSDRLIEYTGEVEPEPETGSVSNQKTTINGQKLKRCNVNNNKVKKIYVNGVKVWSATPEYLYNVGAWNTEYLTGFSNDTVYENRFNVSASTSAQGGENAITVTAISNENIDWSCIDYITINGTWHGHTDEGGANKASSLTIKIGDQTIPLNTKTVVETNETLPITIQVYVYVNAWWTDENGNPVAFGVIADVDVTSILTE